MQTRHAYARLVARVEPQPLDWLEAGQLAATQKLLAARLAAVRSLRISKRADGTPILFAAGPDDAQLLAIEPADDANSRNAFAEVGEGFI